MILLFLFTIFSLDSIKASENKTKLYIGSFSWFTDPDGPYAWAVGLKPPTDMAFADINAREDVLAGYELVQVHYDSQASPGVAIREFFRMVQDPPTKMFLLGPCLSQVVPVVAETAKWWNLIQVAGITFTPTLSDRSRFPYFFRTRAALTSFNTARVAFLKHHDWRRVALIGIRFNWATEVLKSLSDMLSKENITVLAFEAFETDPTPVIKKIKDVDARIIFVLGFDEALRKLFCQAFKEGLYGSKYVWIVHGGNEKYWMDQPVSDGACAVEDIQHAADGHIIVSDITVREDNVETISGHINTNFLAKCHEVGRACGVPCHPFYAGLSYDAVWAAALALNNSIGKFQDDKCLENFTYNDDNMRGVIMEEMYKLNFDGISGKIMFSQTGDIETLKTKFMQYLLDPPDNFVEIAIHDMTTDKFEWRRNVTWKGSKAPYDQRQVVRKRSFVSRGMFYFFTGMACLGVISSLAFGWINISKKEHRIIRMSSPNMNNLIIVGCMLAYISVMVYGLESLYYVQDINAIKNVCQVRVCLLAISFSLAFGSLFAKTWRVFAIFTNKSLKKMNIKDHKLILMVFSFVVFDVLYIVTWFLVSPWSVHSVNSTEVFTTDDVTIQYYIYGCNTDSQDVWMGTLLGIKGLFLTFGVFLAWQTRKVNIPALNDSRYIGFAVYNIMMVSLVGVPTVYLLEVHQHEAKYAISGCCILTVTTVTQCIVFIPKLYGIRTQRIDQMPTVSYDIQSRIGRETGNSRVTTQPGTSRIEPSDNGCIVKEFTSRISCDKQ